MCVRIGAWILAFACCLQLCGGQVQLNCGGSLVYLKRAGEMPEFGMLALLHNSSTPGITAECFNRCLNQSSRCSDLLIDYDASACFRVVTNSPEYIISPLPPAAFIGTSLEVTTSRNINYFQQTCLAVPDTCRERFWVVEVVRGYDLIGYSTAVYNVSSYEECAQRCLSQPQPGCLSASFYGNVDGSGRCKLNAEDRRTKPDSYRPSADDVLYIENQCSLSEGSTCSFEEYLNSALFSFTDVFLTNITKAQCEQRCIAESRFHCRGVSYTPAGPGPSDVGQCSLHGEDSLGLGPGAIVPRPGTVFLERPPCLDLLVTCDASLLNVTLRTKEPFGGRLFVNGFSNTCSSEGKGSLATSLLLPLAAGNASQQCGVTVARSIAETIRTLASALVVIQYNKILQRRGDRALRVGCLMEEGSPRNISLGAGITFPTDPDLELGIGNVIVNSSTGLPAVRIRLVDPISGQPVANLTHLGDLLQLRVDLEQTSVVYHIMITHLLAMTDDRSQSVLLVDGRGCPPDPPTFPGFTRDPLTGSLQANFRAFKFPGSSVVRFSAMVQFCPGECQLVDCPESGLSFGRWRRSSDRPASENVSIAWRELPVELAFTVLDPKTAGPSRLLNDTVASNQTSAPLPVLTYEALVCVSYGSFLGIVLGWMAIQVIVLIACFFLVRWWMRREEKIVERKVMEEFHAFENKRVRWADMGPYC